MPLSPKDPQITAAMKELVGRQITLVMPGIEAMMLVGALQMILRHPNLPDNIRAHTENICAQIADWLAESDARLAPLIEACYDPREDTPALPEAVRQPGEWPEIYLLFRLTEEGDEEFVMARDEMRRWWPVMALDPSTLPEMRVQMREIAELDKTAARIVRFYGREIIEEAKP